MKVNFISHNINIKKIPKSNFTGNYVKFKADEKFYKNLGEAEVNKQNFQIIVTFISMFLAGLFSYLLQDYNRKNIN